MSTYNYCYRRVKNGMMMTGSITTDKFEEVLSILTEASTDTMEVIYIIKVG